MKIGILALQGNVRRHADALRACGAEPVAVKTKSQLDDVDGLILPGGESTTISMLLDRFELADPLAERLNDGMPTFGTCAGMILLAAEVLDGRPDQRSYAAIDITVRRNGYGRQVDSFETDLAVDGVGTVPATFIRAPVVERVGDGVSVLASVGGRPVLCAQNKVLVAAFHPELSDDRRLHQHFLEEV